MNGIVKPVYTIQQNPKGEWRLTKGNASLLFATEEDAINGMTKWINTKIIGYDKDGNQIIGYDEKGKELL